MDGVLLSDMGIDGTVVPPRKRGGSSESYRHSGHVMGSRRRGQGGPRGAAFGTRETNRGGPLLRGGGSILAAQELVNIKAATDHDWRALECVRINGIGETIRLMRTRPKDVLQEANPSVVIGNVVPGESGADIIKAFVRPKVRTLLLERAPHLPNAELWCTSVEPMLDESYQTDKAELKSAA